MKLVLKNGKVLTEDRIIKNGSVVVAGSKIERILENSSGTDSYDLETYEVIDCKGCYISPGFIDTHIHGGGGADFMDGTIESIEKILSIHTKHGTTSLLATTLSASRQDTIKALDNITRFQQTSEYASIILGVHLEGNYFSMYQKGAQNPEYIKSPEDEEYNEFVKHAKIRMVSAAPEIENSLKMARDLSAQGIVMSIGHSDANYNECIHAIENGYSHITHIYNGNSSLKSLYYYAQTGVCEAGLLFDELTIEAIADGKHLPPEFLKLLYKIKGPDRMHAVTDAGRPTGLPEGTYIIGGQEVLLEDNVAMLKDRSSFAGSVSTTDRLLRVLYKEAGIPILDSVKMLTITPAKVLGISNMIGRLTSGYQADINVFDDDINILATIKNGVAIYSEI